MMAGSKNIAEVVERPEQMRADLAAMLKGLDRFENKRDMLIEGRALDGRLGVCIDVLKELDKEQ
jgi:hypothetical protein